MAGGVGSSPFVARSDVDARLCFANGPKTPLREIQWCCACTAFPATEFAHVCSLASRSKLECVTVAVCVLQCPATPCSAVQQPGPKGRASSLNLVYQVFKNMKPEPNRFWVFLVKTGTEKVEPCFCPTYMHSLVVSEWGDARHHQI